jgi:hypothetical protein
MDGLNRSHWYRFIVLASTTVTTLEGGGVSIELDFHVGGFVIRCLPELFFSAAPHADQPHIRITASGVPTTMACRQKRRSGLCSPRACGVKPSMGDQRVPSYSRATP